MSKAIMTNVNKRFEYIIITSNVKIGNHLEILKELKYSKIKKMIFLLDKLVCKSF